jgi:hypothetical protein
VSCSHTVAPVILLLTVAVSLSAQRAELRPAELLSLPGASDSNSPAHWWNGNFSIIQSVGLPIISQGSDPLGSLKARAIALDSYTHTPLWIESTWVDGDGLVYAWYHHEMPVCNGQLSMPAIGALISSDGGTSFRDLGIILDSGYAPDCSSRNGYFAGGHGDFTVLPDQELQFFYFYFGNYSGPDSSQGIAAARLAFADRANPIGRVHKFFRGAWREPGLGGRVSAFLPAYVAWNQPNADSFWGPSLHWNSFLNQYVMLLNRACCEPRWPAEGIYVSFNYDLASPYSWSPPQKLLSREEAGWYPQIIGLEPGMSDKLAGQTARFFVGSDSRFEIHFSR